MVLIPIGILTELFRQLPHNTQPSFSSLYELGRQVAPFPFNKAMNIAKPLILETYDYLHPEGSSLDVQGLIPAEHRAEIVDPNAEQRFTKTFTYNHYRYFGGGVQLFW